MSKVVMTTKGTASALKTSELEHEVFVHPLSVIDPSVQLGDRVIIHANVIIERGVRIEEGTVIHPGCYIGDDCVIGENTVIHASTVLREKTIVGKRVTIESGVVIGSDGFGYAKENDGINCKVPQIGNVIIEDDVYIGANTTIDRATLGRTIIGKGARIGKLVQVGHNVIVGSSSQVGNGVGICGSCSIGSSVTIGHGVGMVGHIKIGNGAIVQNGSGVSKDVKPDSIISGSPAMEEDVYLKYQEYLTKLPEYLSRLKNLENLLGTEESEQE